MRRPSEDTIANVIVGVPIALGVFVTVLWLLDLLDL